MSIFVDVFSVTVALHYFGGTYALIWVADYMLLVAVYSLFLNKKERLILLAYVVVTYSLLCLFEHYGVLVRHNIFQIPVSPKMDLACWLSAMALILLTGLISNNFIEMLIKYQRLADLGRFSTELAHEIRTPLQVIEGITHGANLPEDAKQEIRSQIERIGRFIREVTALGREERQHLIRARLQDLVGVVVSDVLKAVPQKTIRLVKRFNEQDLWVRIDADQVTKALSNLVRNGIDSINQDGLVEVTVDRSGFEWARVIVRDTGVGIDKDELERIFEPFYTTKTGIRGVGLGLAIARKCIEANGGKIDVESRAGSGSRFIAWIPLCEEEDPMAETSAKTH
jgi:signal transduction histidine kinase